MATIFGTNGPDSLTGTSSDDDIFGWAQGGSDATDTGNDVLRGAEGNDRIWGGGGDDTFFGGAGADVFTGGAGNDTAAYSDSGAAVDIDLAIGRALGGD